MVTMLKQGALIALAATVSTVAAAAQGFNYGSTDSSGAPVTQAGFHQLFTTAQNLVGTKGWSSARLYTMIQAGTPNSPIEAIPAAISTKTGLLLGMWASAGQDGFNQELTALKNAISQYGPQLAPLVEGISVGSEDLYRETPTGIANKAGVGAGPNDIVNYIKQVRGALAGTPLSGAKIGHVDTWTAWVNGSNSAVIQNVDFLGLDEYPYFENTHPNAITDGKADFQDAFGATQGVAGGKPIWVTETAWPVSGPNFGQAVANPANAETYWKQVICPMIGSTNLYYYTLFDAPSSPSFGLVSSASSTTPLFDLSCDGSGSGSGSSSKPAPSGSSLSTQAPDHQETATVPVCSECQDVTVTVTPTVYETAVCSECSGAKPTASGSPTPETGKQCPANLTGDYQYPHLMVPVDSSNPSKAAGTQYFGTISSTISTLYNFDIPASYAGKTCNLVFLFPEKSQLETSDYTYSTNGGIKVDTLSSAANASTDYANKPAVSGEAGSIASLESGTAHTIASGPCEAGKTVSYMLSSTNGLVLKYFQDYNPCPLGLYVTTS